MIAMNRPAKTSPAGPPLPAPVATTVGSGAPGGIIGTAVKPEAAAARGAQRKRKSGTDRKGRRCPLPAGPRLGVASPPGTESPQPTAPTASSRTRDPIANPTLESILRARQRANATRALTTPLSAAGSAPVPVQGHFEWPLDPAEVAATRMVLGPGWVRKGPRFNLELGAATPDGVNYAVTAKPHARGSRTTRSLTIEELAKIEFFVRHQPSALSKAAIVQYYVQLESGLRISEVICWPWEILVRDRKLHRDFTLPGDWCKVEGTPDRLLRLSPRTLVLIRELMDEAIANRTYGPERPIFPSTRDPAVAISYATARRRLLHLLTAALPTTHRLGTHSLRKTALNLLWLTTNDIVLVQQVAGHRNATTTLRYLGLGGEFICTTMDVSRERVETLMQPLMAVLEKAGRKGQATFDFEADVAAALKEAAFRGLKTHVPSAGANGDGPRNTVFALSVSRLHRDRARKGAAKRREEKRQQQRTDQLVARISGDPSSPAANPGPDRDGGAKLAPQANAPNAPPGRPPTA